MSGCARCVYDIYAEDLQLFNSDLSQVRQKLDTMGLSDQEWDEGLLGKRSGEMDAKRSAEDEVEAVIGDLDPTMKAFLEMERKMKDKNKPR